MERSILGLQHGGVEMGKGSRRGGGSPSTGAVLSPEANTGIGDLNRHRDKNGKIYPWIAARRGGNG